MTHQRQESSMMNERSARFWQPAPEAATELMCAYVESSESPLHLHEEWQFGVVNAPSKLSLGAFRRYGAGLDDVTIVQPYAVHGEGRPVESSAGWHLLLVDSAMVRRHFGGEATRNAPIATDPIAATELRELIQGSADGTIAAAEFLRRVNQWLERFLRLHAIAQSAPRQLPPVQRARAYLQNRPTEPVPLSEVGTVAGVTLSHLVRSFSRTVGLPPRSYHAQVRLARARRLLADGKPATWVAYECGFADQSHLNRRFKECHGMTPGAFQAQFRGHPLPVSPDKVTAA
jgi:AraC-like DNA-binding protein